jgi:hypothetical protein
MKAPILLRVILATLFGSSLSLPAFAHEYLSAPLKITISHAGLTHQEKTIARKKARVFFSKDKEACTIQIDEKEFDCVVNEFQLKGLGRVHLAGGDYGYYLTIYAPAAPILREICQDRAECDSLLSTVKDEAIRIQRIAQDGTFGSIIALRESKIQIDVSNREAFHIVTRLGELKSE